MDIRALSHRDTFTVCVPLLASGAGAVNLPHTGVLGSGKKARGSS
jgi:hypothetical protein